MSAARQISRPAVGDPTLRLPTSKYEAPRFGRQKDQASEDLPFGSRGGIAVHHYFPLEGDCLLRIRLQYLDKSSIIALTEPHKLDVRLDGLRTKDFTMGGRPGAAGSRDDVNSAYDGGLELRFPTKAGSHLVSVSFRDEKTLSEGMHRPEFVQLEHDGQGPRIE
jgi:hypothetical protein